MIVMVSFAVLTQKPWETDPLKIYRSKPEKCRRDDVRIRTHGEKMKRLYRGMTFYHTIESPPDPERVFSICKEFPVEKSEMIIGVVRPDR